MSASESYVSQQHNSPIEDLIQSLVRLMSAVSGISSMLFAALSCLVMACGIASILALLLLLNLTSSPLTSSQALFFDSSHTRAVATLDLQSLYQPYAPHSTSYFSWIGAMKETLFPKLPDISLHDQSPNKEAAAEQKVSPEPHPNVLQAIQFQREHERHIGKAGTMNSRFSEGSVRLPPAGMEFRLTLKLSIPSRAKSSKPILIVQVTCELMSDDGEVIDRSTRQKLIVDSLPLPLSFSQVAWRYSFWLPCKITGFSFFCVDIQKASVKTELLLFEDFVPLTPSSISPARAVRVILGPSSTHRWDIEHSKLADVGISGLVTVADEAQLVLEPKKWWIMRQLYYLRQKTLLLILWGLLAVTLTLLGGLAFSLSLFIAIGLLKFAGNQKSAEEDQSSFVDGISQQAEEDPDELSEGGMEGGGLSMEELQADPFSSLLNETG